MDAVIHGGVVLLSDGPADRDIGIVGGRIASIGPDLSTEADEIIDARGLHVLPGGIDAHVHFNEPGRTQWEGWQTGSRALAAGGTTTCVEMPCNAIPPTVSGPNFALKLELASKLSHVDFALWGGIVPGNRAELSELAACGVAGFKAFMCATGLEEFPGCDDLTLYEAMVEAGRLGLPVLVHAENDAITAELAVRARAEGRTGARDFCASRPALAELEAVSRAIVLAEDAGCALHVVHVSSGRAVAAIAEARMRGVDVSCETCPHYLVLTEEDIERLGPIAKCSPPVRGAADRETLWDALRTGTIQMLASDHSPCPPEMKTGDFFDAWGGVAGCQSLLELLLSEGYHSRGVELRTIVGLVAGFPARRFQFRGKGSIELGADADFALVDLGAERVLAREELLDRHRQSPFVGRKLRGRVVRTVVRGLTVARDGHVSSPPCGRFVRPVKSGTSNQVAAGV
jgi:allantoinase